MLRGVGVLREGRTHHSEEEDLRVEKVSCMMEASVWQLVRQAWNPGFQNCY